MRPKIIHKNWLFFLPLILPVLFVLLLPSIAHAESIQATLRDNQNIKDLHNGFLTVINIPVTLVIIVVAFAEMLHLKVDTYGFKKVLPTLILAIIAAQFSYLICKLIIDAANMVMTLFTTPGLIADAAGLPNRYQTAFKGLIDNNPTDWSHFQYSMFFSKLLDILFLLVGSVLLLVLCFLFLVRTWMIYFLVIISSVAFMALALPQTKTYFNKWLSAFFKWTFMPVPSVVFLWLGTVFINTPIVTTSWLPLPIINIIIACICLWAAIYVPLKMGGGIMDKFLRFSGAKWGLDKARKNWLDPFVDDWKRRVSIWYKSNGSGAVYNPLGMMVRRSRLKGWEREQRKREDQGWDNQLLREALGGKFGKDGDKYMSRERQDKYGEWLDNIDSLFGEQEWKELDLREKYFRTAKGKEATLRSAQYGFRMEGTQQLIDNEKRVAKIKALSGSDEYMKDDHYKRMIELRNRAKSDAFTLEMTEGKLEGDLYQEVEGNAYLLDMSLESIRTFTSTLEDLKIKLLEAETEDEKRLVQAQINQAQRDLDKSHASYQARMKTFYEKYFNKKTKKWEGLSYVLQQMVTDENGGLIGVTTDNKGNFVSADHTKTRSFEQAMGFDFDTAEKAWRYLAGRRTKRFSLIVDGEKSSVMNKRDDTDAIYELENNPRLLAALPYVITGNTSLLDEYQIRKGDAELYTVITKGMNSISNDKYTADAKKLAEWSASFAAGNLDENSVQLRSMLADACSAYLNRVVNNPQTQSTIRKQASAQFQDEIDAAVAAAPPMNSEEEKIFREKFIADELPKSEAYRKALEQFAKDYVSTEGLHLGGTAIEGDWDSDVQLEYSVKTGGFIPKVTYEANDETEAQRVSTFLESLSNTINTGPTRGVFAEGKNSWLGTMKERIPVVKRQAGKNEEETLGWERVPQRMEQAAQREYEKIMAEKGSVDARADFLKYKKSKGDIDVD